MPADCMDEVHAGEVPESPLQRLNWVEKASEKPKGKVTRSTKPEVS